MSCNWEYFELKLKVNTTTVSGFEFGNVTLDLASLGIADFTGSNYSCNFEYVFGQLAKLKIIRANFPKQVKIVYPNNTAIIDQAAYLGVLQQAAGDRKVLAGSTLYVHRRDQSPATGAPTGVRLSMKGVTVLGTDNTQQDLFVLLTADSAKVEH